ncbi:MULTISPECIES: pyridoxamine 5'-phosphate oxidase family protein [Streptomyces]|uniref:pyridoxamine 5'-phosphate oxidase family protein n=1 Tax=Streptomyces TaxID=1883 RepID=UPI00163D3A85|nr:MULTISPECIES: pyridoxamine 5'-phosphate oxidase family protein [Streptomyces]MBC2875847.1 pyridoxamine 5'-phosphate oxidase family protein [Streptomyces sp. TYQ1024]UBI37697.1 pyridoxamine 5'-phosphate oxidase family protein [Streptomyces mobaraensis]UKW30283.1 pyridoxamine 5'-phosphate oxidase family protein [Streptomyces sp. TYQ1024]
MYETPEDMKALQRLLDDSYAGAGPHLRRIIGEDRRMDATGVVAALDGIKIMALATAGTSGDPRVGPVDGHFYRGRFHFGSGPDSVRVRHIRARPAVSATFFDGQRLQITVHGKAVQVSPTEDPDLENYLIELHGRALWDGWLKDMAWARIDPGKMFTFRNPEP